MTRLERKIANINSIKEHVQNFLKQANWSKRYRKNKMEAYLKIAKKLSLIKKKKIRKTAFEIKSFLKTELRKLETA